MTVTQDAVGRRVVLSPQEALVAGGPAEEFEQRVQALFRDGSRTSSSISGRCRRSTAVGSGRWSGPTRRRSGWARRSGLPVPARPSAPSSKSRSSIMCSRSTTRSMPPGSAKLRWDLVWFGLAGGALCAALVWGGLRWPLVGNPDVESVPGGPEVSGTPLLTQPFLALVKLGCGRRDRRPGHRVHAPSATDRPSGRAMQHAQILLCVAGAMMMIIIGNSLARAFGIAGAASIVRFRTPVEGPQGRHHHLPADVARHGVGPRRVCHRRPRHGVLVRVPVPARSHQRAAHPGSGSGSRGLGARVPHRSRAQRVRAESDCVRDP